MSGGGWQHLAASAKELAGATQTKAKAVTHTLGKAVLATGKEVRQLVAPPEAEAEHQGVDGRHVEGPPQQVHDAYGFSFEVTPAQAAILERCRSKQEQQLAKWQQYQRDEGLAPPPDTLKRLCRKGVPPELRRQVWLALSGATQRRQRHPPHYYASSALQGASSPLAHQIELDVPRTFPNNEWVQSEAGQAAVRHVLLACAHHNPRVGYCQSMNYLAAMLLLVLGRGEEEEAFWVLASLIDDEDEGILYKDMYANDLTGTHVEMRCLRELVQHKLPRLAAHMDALGCDMSILATDWFLCLFCTSLPMETAARVWDALMNEGTKVLFRVALALLKLHEPLLLAQDNPGELLQVTRRAAAEAFDRDALMKVAFEGVGSMPMERIDRYRARKQREVDREMAARETRVNLQAAVAEQGFVVTEAEAQLLRAQQQRQEGEEEEERGRRQRQAAEADGQDGAAAGTSGGSCPTSPMRSGSGSGGGGRWVSQLQALGSSLGGKAKDSIDRGRMRISHRRGQSLGGSSQ